MEGRRQRCLVVAAARKWHFWDSEEVGESSSTTMKTKLCNRLSTCTNKCGNCSYNHICAAFGPFKRECNAEPLGDYPVWCTRQLGSALQSAVAHLKVKCGKLLTSLLSQHHGRRRTRPTVSLSLTLSLLLIYIMDGSFSLQDRVNT